MTESEAVLSTGEAKEGHNPTPYQHNTVVIRSEEEVGWLMELLDEEGVAVAQRFAYPPMDRQSIVQEAVTFARWLGAKLVIGKVTEGSDE